MAIDSTVLSLSFDAETLRRRESALRKEGFEVISVHSPAQARFEIEMGRCGIFVTCRLVPDIINRDLMSLFRRYCSTGWIVFVTGDDESSTTTYEPPADVRVPESQDPEGIVQALVAHGREPRAS
ncbi:MAG TPA: hypothetical protein VI386_02795 [Candidatus Sulfotelmatobacter sp.]